MLYRCFTPADAVPTLCARYGDVRSDVAAVLEALLALGLLQRLTGAASEALAANDTLTCLRVAPLPAHPREGAQLRALAMRAYAELPRPYFSGATLADWLVDRRCVSACVCLCNQ